MKRSGMQAGQRTCAGSVAPRRLGVKWALGFWHTRKCKPTCCQARANDDRPSQAMDLPVYVQLEEGMHQHQALRGRLRMLRSIGFGHVGVDVLWGAVERDQPGEYDWSLYQRVFDIIQDEGLTIKVALGFHRSLRTPLPEWVRSEAQANPDILYTDRRGHRSLDCLSLGVDNVPVVAGRTGIECCLDLMTSFREQFGSWLGSTIRECSIGMGPGGQLQYPSQPLDERWAFPGIGEFQCYDRYMLASLAACAQQVQQPSWGLAGPHDAGSYCNQPQMTAFFSDDGTHTTDYGQFFLQWYSQMLNRHGDLLLDGANKVFAAARPHLALDVKIPAPHWWFHTAARAAEATAGYYSGQLQQGYLPVFMTVARHGCGVQLQGLDRITSEQPAQYGCDPQQLLAIQRATAAALRVPVSMENAEARYDEASLARMEASLFDEHCHRGIELPKAQGLVLHRFGDTLLEPDNWQRVSAFVARVNERSAAGGTAVSGGGNLSSLVGAVPKNSKCTGHSVGVNNGGGSNDDSSSSSVTFVRQGSLASMGVAAMASSDAAQHSGAPNHRLLVGV